MEVLEGDYEQSYRTVEPSRANNVLGLYEANVTNLGKDTLDTAYTSNLETTAIDDAAIAMIRNALLW